MEITLFQALMLSIDLSLNKDQVIAPVYISMDNIIRSSWPEVFLVKGALKIYS